MNHPPFTLSARALRIRPALGHARRVTPRNRRERTIRDDESRVRRGGSRLDQGRGLRCANGRRRQKAPLSPGDHAPETGLRGPGAPAELDTPCRDSQKAPSPSDRKWVWASIQFHRSGQIGNCRQHRAKHPAAPFAASAPLAPKSWRASPAGGYAINASCRNNCRRVQERRHVRPRFGVPRDVGFELGGIRRCERS